MPKYLTKSPLYTYSNSPNHFPEVNKVDVGISCTMYEHQTCTRVLPMSCGFQRYQYCKDWNLSDNTAKKAKYQYFFTSELSIYNPGSTSSCTWKMLKAALITIIGCGMEESWGIILMENFLKNFFRKGYKLFRSHFWYSKVCNFIYSPLESSCLCDFHLHVQTSKFTWCPRFPYLLYLPATAFPWQRTPATPQEVVMEWVQSISRDSRP